MCDLRILCRQLRTNGRVHILRLLRRSCPPGANGPNRFVSDNGLGKSTDTQLLDNTMQLTRNHCHRLAGFVLLQGFPYTEHRDQTTSLCRRELAIQSGIRLTYDQAPLGVPHQNQGATCIDQLARRNLTGQSALHGVYRSVLRTDRNRPAFQTFNHLIDMQARREYRNINSTR